MPLSSPALIALAWTLSPTGLTGAAGSAQDGPDYAAEIATIFEQRCVECHGPDREESGLRLDLFPRVLRGGDSGEPGVVAGAAARSEVLRRVTTEDEFEVMPPAGERLSDADAALLRRWIDAGAHGPEGEQATGDPTWTGQVTAARTGRSSRWRVVAASRGVVRRRWMSSFEPGWRRLGWRPHLRPSGRS